MENKEIPVNREEYSRLCRLDGKMDALIGYLALKNDYVEAQIVKQLSAWRTNDVCRYRTGERHGSNG